MNGCIFCKIIAGEIPSKKVYEDDMIYVFHDINPSAPVHLLCVPKIHMDSLNDVNQSNIEYVSHILGKIPELAESFGIIDGYRVITNIGEDGGQSVKHLHFHVLGGRKLGYLG
jgi:histidine triad (HIT) family protein